MSGVLEEVLRRLQNAPSTIAQATPADTEKCVNSALFSAHAFYERARTLNIYF